MHAQILHGRRLGRRRPRNPHLDGDQNGGVHGLLFPFVFGDLGLHNLLRASSDRPRHWDHKRSLPRYGESNPPRLLPRNPDRRTHRLLLRMVRVHGVPGVLGRHRQGDVLLSHGLRHRPPGGGSGRLLLDREHRVRVQREHPESLLVLPVLLVLDLRVYHGNRSTRRRHLRLPLVFHARQDVCKVPAGDPGDLHGLPLPPRVGRLRVTDHRHHQDHPGLHCVPTRPGRQARGQGREGRRGPSQDNPVLPAVLYVVR
mmetsp:Transcript_63296/g.142759  ORF Transcript_63296/g.142759 Transcript_63296/m.142759 type:complete len:256 (+) Transcript_63296:600-1367(+)